MIIKRAAKKFLTGKVTPKRTAVKRKPAIKMLDRGEIENIIREQAYKLYEQRGGNHGADLNDWLEAERIVTKV